MVFVLLAVLMPHGLLKEAYSFSCDITGTEQPGGRAGSQVVKAKTSILPRIQKSVWI
jgi:hypothetical protein